MLVIYYYHNNNCALLLFIVCLIYEHRALSICFINYLEALSVWCVHINNNNTNDDANQNNNISDENECIVFSDVRKCIFHGNRDSFA